MTNVMKVMMVLIMSMMMVLLKNDGKAWRVWSTPVPRAAGELCPALGKRQTNPSTEFHLWNYHHKMISILKNHHKNKLWANVNGFYIVFFRITITNHHNNPLLNRLFIREIQLLIAPYNWHDNLWRRCPWKWLSPASALIILGPVAIRWVVKGVHWPIRSLLLNSFAVSGLPEYYQHLWVGDGQMCLNRKVRLVSLFFLRFQLHNRIPLTSFMTRAAWYLSFFSSFILSPELPHWSADRLIPSHTKSFLTFSPLTRIWVLGKHKRLWSLIHAACSTSMQYIHAVSCLYWQVNSTMPC